MRLVFLNGCTSAGNSRIVGELQARAAPPFLRYGIDEAIAMLPRWLHDHPDGFSFDTDRRGLARLNYGTVGSATLLAHLHAAVATAESGNDLTLDEVVLENHLRVWNGALC